MDANWDDLRVFLTLAREGTLTTAAKALGVSHPTVSRRVQALEQQIGARLFERLPDRFVPTSAGEELLADTEAMEKAALSINRRSAGLSDTVSGVVRLSAGEAMAVLVARHLPWLRARLQQIEFEVIASHTLANLSRREADLLIREQVPELAGIVTRKLCHVAYAIYAARNVSSSSAPSMPALVDLPWIGFDDDHSYMPGQRWMHEQLGRRPEIRVNNWLVLHEAVRVGAGPCRAALLSRRPGPEAAPRRRRAARGLDRAVAAGPSRPPGPAAGAGGHGRAGRALPASPLHSGGARRTDCAIVGRLSGRAPMKKTMLALALVSVATAAHAENGVLPMAGKPEDVGLSSAQLKRLEEVTQKHVDSGLVPGAVMLVARRGKIAWVSTLGKRDVAAGDAMKPDAIFRIYSMTKPIVSVAVMQMVEEGRLQVSDPVSKFLPEIGKMKVGTEKVVDGRAVLQLGDPERAMTVQDLLRHTSGLTYGTRGTALVNQSYVEAKIGDRGMSNEEFVSQALHLGAEVLARHALGIRRVDRRAGPPGRSGRRQEARRGARRAHLQAAGHGRYRLPGAGRQAFAGGAARAAAQRPADDAALRRERRREVRIRRRRAHLDHGRLSALHHHAGQWRRAFRQARAGQADAGLHDGRPYRQPSRPAAGLGFGLGFEVRTMTGEAALPGSVGEYGWAGNAGTLFWVDPKEQLFAIYMVQVSDPDRIALRNQFRTMVQAAIID